MNDKHPFNYTKGEKIEQENCIAIRVYLSHLHPYCCGYIYFNKKDIPESWWGEKFLTDAKPCAELFNNIEVHGGITFSERYGDTLVYGFDRAHANDDENPLSNDIEDTLKITVEFRDSFLNALNRCKELKK